jgi:hypothetical protein
MQVVIARYNGDNNKDTCVDTLHSVVSVIEFPNSILTNITVRRNSNATTKVLNFILQLRIKGFILDVYAHIVLIRRDSRYYGNRLTRSRSNEEGNTLCRHFGIAAARE